MTKLTHRQCRPPRGFSLLELVIAVALIGAVTAVTVQWLSQAQKQQAESSESAGKKQLSNQANEELYTEFLNSEIGPSAAAISSSATSSIGGANEVTTEAIPLLQQFDRSLDGFTCELDYTAPNRWFDVDCTGSGTPFTTLTNNLGSTSLLSNDIGFPIYVAGSAEICTAKDISVTGGTIRATVCGDSDDCGDSDGLLCLKNTSGNLVSNGSAITLPRYQVIADQQIVSYYIEPLNSRGQANFDLEIASDFYADFTQPSGSDACDTSLTPDDETCVVPVRENNTRSLNSAGKIKVSSEHAADSSYTLSVSLKLEDGEAAGNGTIELSENQAADTNSSDQIIEVSGNLFDINDHLENIEYTGASGVFEDEILEISVTMGGKTVTTASGSNVLPHIALDVYPNCGCEQEGRTAVSFEVGTMNDSAQFVGETTQITTLALTDTQAPRDFYGWRSSSDSSCLHPDYTNGGDHCNGSSKQQAIAQNDALVVFVYEMAGQTGDAIDLDWCSTNSSCDADSRFTLMYLADRTKNSCIGTGGGQPESALWGGISGGTGIRADAWADSLSFWPSEWPDDAHGCKVIWDISNIPGNEYPSSAYPFLHTGGTISNPKIEDTNDEYPGFNSFSGNTYRAFSRWSGDIDGIMLGLPVTSSSAELETYTPGNNPKFHLRYYDNLKTWRFRGVRTSNCSVAEETDENAWIDGSKTDWDDLYLHPKLADNSVATPTTFSSLIGSSVNGLQLEVGSAKRCPNPDLFAD